MSQEPLKGWLQPLSYYPYTEPHNLEWRRQPVPGVKDDEDESDPLKRDLDLEMLLKIIMPENMVTVISTSVAKQAIVFMGYLLAGKSQYP
jgi:hypothetical protein